jgi:hypothetical protein
MGARDAKGVVVGTALVLFALLTGCGGAGDEGSDANSHINGDSGSTNGVSPDNRAGIPPPPVAVTNLEKAAEDAGCYLSRNLDDEGHKHLSPGAAEPEYETDPPSSGPHVEPPDQQADGAYLEMPSPADYVASLDHGRLEIQYAPDLSEKVQRELKGLYDTMYGGTLLFPNYKMNFGVAATTWTNALDCPGWEGSNTLDAIRAFGKATWGKYGNNPVKAFPVEGPTPVKPEVASEAG